MPSERQSQEVFDQLKNVCVPLLGTSLLSPKTAPNASKLLSQLLNELHDVKTSGFILTPSLISYTFFPLSTMLRRNSAPDIPDQVLEKIFLILGILCEAWWWDCDMMVWEQIFMLCGAVIGGIEGKGKGRARDDETKTAAAQCLHSLLRKRTSEGERAHSQTPGAAQKRLEEFQAYSQTDKFLPILGQTLNSLLTTVESPTLALQRVTLELLALFIGTYAPTTLFHQYSLELSVACQRYPWVAQKSKGWANGEIVAGALNTMLSAVVRAIGDDICIQEGALRHVVDLEDLAESVTEPPPRIGGQERRQYSTLRTPSWLRGTSSQLLIAMNTLNPLVSHPKPSALLALSAFSSAVLSATSLTLPHAQPLLLSFLLSLSLSSYSVVSDDAHKSLLMLLTIPSNAQHSLLQTILHKTNENLSALPRLLPTHADAKVEHIAGLIEAVCRLAATDERPKSGLLSISSGIGKLLGPAGGIEKWGWNLLSVLEFTEPSITVFQTSTAQLMLESDSQTSPGIVFPDVAFKNVSSDSTRAALERMFRALGHAGGDSCLFSAEWFANVARQSSGPRSAAAAWCACRLLEGVAGISLTQGHSGDPVSHRRTKRLLKLARTLSRSIAELWDEGVDTQTTPTFEDKTEDNQSNLLVQHVHGLSSMHENLRIMPASRRKEQASVQQPMLHRALLLQLLAVSAGILQARFTPMLLYTLYPVLHSLVSPAVYLSSTALATLHFITLVTSHASPANLLLSNFDYALDAVSRRLSRRWLDIDATKVLAIMVRLVGSDVVERAGDVVEECFDRLDEFHGYGVIVEGLVEVLGEVINVINVEAEATPDDAAGSETTPTKNNGHESMEGLLQWVFHRHDEHVDESDMTDYGPAPREAWGGGQSKDEGMEGKDEETTQDPDPNADPLPTPVQALTKQMVSRSMYFLTHGSPVVRSRILSLLGSSVSVLPPSALLPSIHSAWPFILNRLTDPEPFIVSAAASLVEALVIYHGSFMFRRIWDDVWPRFSVLLENLDAADTVSALSRRGRGAVGTESSYTHSHRLYRSVINSMTAALKGVTPHDTSIWQVLLAFRRFLHAGAHEELQRYARDLYAAIGANNADAVWLALSSTSNDTYPIMGFLKASQWEMELNISIIFQRLEA